MKVNDVMYEYHLESAFRPLQISSPSSTAQTFYELKFPLTYRADFILCPHSFRADTWKNV